MKTVSTALAARDAETEVPRTFPRHPAPTSIRRQTHNRRSSTNGIKIRCKDEPRHPLYFTARGSTSHPSFSLLPRAGSPQVRILSRPLTKACRNPHATYLHICLVLWKSLPSSDLPPHPQPSDPFYLYRHHVHRMRSTHLQGLSLPA